MTAERKSNERYRMTLHTQDTSTNPLVQEESVNVTKPRKPYVKPTQADIDERVEYVLEMMIAGKAKGVIVKTGKEKWDVSTRTIESYISRAQGKMVEASNKPKEVLRKEAISVYQAIIDNKESRAIDVIKAQERIDKLHGLEQHPNQRVEISGPDGGPVQQRVATVTVDLSAKLREYADAIRAAAAANVQEQTGLLALPAPTPKP